MNILILGSGLQGVTAAYELGRRGHQVTVLDRQQTSGAETSFANGGQLSYSHAEPWATPGVLPKLPGWLVRPDAPLVFRLRADWQMIRWGLKFLRNCTPARARINALNILRLGLYSRRKFEELRRDTGIEFGYGNKGILDIFGSDADFEHAKRQVEFQAKFGCEQRVLSEAECLTLEPALAATGRHIAGGIHSFMDETGDAYIYCNELAKLAAQRYGVKFEYGVIIKKLVAENNVIAGVTTDRGDISADAYVMAMGSYSPVYLRPLKIDLPVYPMKGYSITVDASEACPALSVADDKCKTVYTRLGNKLRVAGTAEFAGYDTGINPKRIAPMLKAARGLFPGVNWEGAMTSWGCLRPSTPDGPPILGPTPYPNLFLNTGHGTLGWTQAAGSATIVADIIERKIPDILLHGLTMERYLR